MRERSKSGQLHGKYQAQRQFLRNNYSTAAEALATMAQHAE
jgi:hypothetical protein